MRQSLASADDASVWGSSAAWVTACGQLPGNYFSFLARCGRPAPARVARCAATQLQRGLNQQIVVGLGGDRDLTEREVPHLSGWCDRGPVRTGNAAWGPHQEDVYGAILDAAVVLREHIDPSTKRPQPSSPTTPHTAT